MRATGWPTRQAPHGVGQADLLHPLPVVQPQLRVEQPDAPAAAGAHLARPIRPRSALRPGLGQDGAAHGL